MSAAVPPSRFPALSPRSAARWLPVGSAGALVDGKVLLCSAASERSLTAAWQGRSAGGGQEMAALVERTLGLPAEATGAPLFRRRCARPRPSGARSGPPGLSCSAGAAVLGRQFSAAGALVLGRRCARPRSRPRPPVHAFSAEGQRELIVTPLRCLPVAPTRFVCLDFKKLHDYPTAALVIVSMSSVIKAEVVL